MRKGLVYQFILCFLGVSLSASASRDLDSLIVQANLLEEAGKYEEAAQEWIKSTLLHNDYLPGYIHAAEAYQKAGKFELSLTVIERASKLGGRPELYLLAGNARYRLGDYVGAIKEWTDLRTLEPDVTENILRVAMALEANRDWSKALESYEQARESDPDNPDIDLSIKRVVSLRDDALKIIARGKAKVLPEWDRDQWVTQRGNDLGWGYSTLDQITKENVKNLKVAWSFSTGTERGHGGVPLVVGTTMYVQSSYPNYVYALDLTKEGAPIKWMYAPKQHVRAVPVACCNLLVDRGLDYAKGKILMHTVDGQIVALDATNGKEVWKNKDADPSKGQIVTGSGLVINDKYIVGTADRESGVGGDVTAFDITTGKLSWKARSSGPDDDLLLAPDFNAANPHYGRFGLGTSTWPGDEWKRGGGSTSGYWSWDPELNLFYYGTGNAGTWNPTPRKGDNKWSKTIWARNPDNGMAKWAYQMTPWDAWDYDGVNESILTDQVIRGKKYKAMTHFDRNGFAYTLDRTNGSLLVAEPFVYVNWATGIDMKTGRPIEVPEKRTKQGIDTKDICPAAVGGKDQQPAAYSPRTNLFYVPANNICMNHERVVEQFLGGAPSPYGAGAVRTNLMMVPGWGGHWGEFIAWDGATGKKVWGIREPFPSSGGSLVTASNLVFYGTIDGWFKAVDAVSGQLLWKHKVGSGIIAPPMTYRGPDGKQYVAVLSGVGGWFGAIVSLDLPPDDPFGALGEVGAAYAAGLDKATTKGGMLYVFSLD